MQRRLVIAWVMSLSVIYVVQMARQIWHEHGQQFRHVIAQHGASR